MSDKKLVFIEYLSFDSFIHCCEVISTLLLWGLLYLALLTLIGFSYIPLGDPEYGDLLYGEDSLNVSSLEDVFLHSSRMAFIASIFALILFFEYLRSHIGEKHPPDDSSGIDILFFARVPVAALFCSVVFSFFPPAFQTVVVSKQVHSINKEVTYAGNDPVRSTRWKIIE